MSCILYEKESLSYSLFLNFSHTSSSALPRTGVTCVQGNSLSLRHQIHI